MWFNINDKYKHFHLANQKLENTYAIFKEFSILSFFLQKKAMLERKVHSKLINKNSLWMMN